MRSPAAPLSKELRTATQDLPLPTPLAPKADRRDAIGIATLAAVLFLLGYLQSRHKMYWGDEIMGRYVLDAGSWHLFLERWNAGIDSSGFWFYVFAKPWEWVFGRSEMALRLFSAAGVATAAGLIWVTARRFYAFSVVALAVPLIFLDIAVMRWQLANGRCYGVLLAATAFVIFLMLRPAGEPVEPQTSYRPAILLITFFAYDLLAGSHILGMLYAGALLAIQIALDLRAHRLRLPVYLAAVAGIAVIVAASLQNIRSTTALGKPTYWTAKPAFRDLLLLDNFTNSPVRSVLLALLFATLLFLRRNTRRDPVYILLVGFVVVDLVFFGISRVSTSIYVDRYLTPFFAALVLLCAELLTQLRDLTPLHSRLASFVPALIAFWGLLEAPRVPANEYPQADFTGTLLAALPPSLPVVDTDVASFVDTEFYHHGRFGRPFFYPLDPGVTANPHNVGGVSGLHEMDNFARLGLDMPDLQPTGKILSRYKDLLVITNDETPTAWLPLRILSTHGYAVTKLSALKGEVPITLWRADRLDTPTTASPQRR